MALRQLGALSKRMAGCYTVDVFDARTFSLDALPSDMRSRHTHEWHRYVLHGPDYYVAARIAAQLGWWLHCWDWKEASSYAITDKDPPIPWASWHAYANTPRGRRRTS